MPGSPTACADPAALDAALRAGYAAPVPARLAALHLQAARLPGPDRARRFHLTHALVFALEAGDDPLAAAIEAALAAYPPGAISTVSRWR